MNPATRGIALAGAAGRIDCSLDLPATTVRAIAVIAHPHPLYGGTRDNKVVQTIARALLDAGCACWRPDFRGVGASEGTHDEGRGETDDLLAVLEAAAGHPSAAHLPTPRPVILAGFSFGSFVQSRVLGRLDRERFRPGTPVFVGTAAARFAVDAVPADTVVIHGETDDVVPLSAVLDWARPQVLPVIVLPDTGHFFHGRLNLLRRLIGRNLRLPGGDPADAGDEPSA